MVAKMKSYKGLDECGVHRKVINSIPFKPYVGVGEEAPRLVWD